ncbi:MAG: A/G-specific adenine glycosylase, partial [Verrucomicrobiota bacterium]
MGSEEKATKRLQKEILGPLLDWYAKHARPLPWRKTRDPYAIWISEIMLQQTQVATVIPYWDRWMSSFPDIASLAAASEASVLKHWEGLGYYRRARSIIKVAAILNELDHQGRFPEDYDTIISLPGIGPYTAGAICSIDLDKH